MLGSWLSLALVKQGAHVFALDREFRSGSLINQAPGRIDFVPGDICDLDFMMRVINEYEIDFVFHFAAQAIVGAAARNPISTFKSNIEGTWNVLEACRVLRQSSNRPRGCIVASSDKAYGDQELLPYVEHAPMQGRYPYDVSKSCADLIAQSYFHSYQLPVCVTRCGNMYGGGDLQFSRIVPKTIMSALKGEKITIRSDGSPVRDYLYVKDASDANLAIAERMLEDASVHGEIFNIGCEKPISVLQIVHKIISLLGREDLSPIVQGKATLEIQRQYLDSSKLRSLIGWRPLYDLERGLLETIEWYQNYAVRDLGLVLDPATSSALERHREREREQQKEREPLPERTRRSKRATD